jgi:putative chitinase
VLLAFPVLNLNTFFNKGIAYALNSACWFWNANNLNVLADAQDIKMMTKKINGGFIGLEDRIKHYNHAVDILQG